MRMPTLLLVAAGLALPARQAAAQNEFHWKGKVAAGKAIERSASFGFFCGGVAQGERALKTGHAVHGGDLPDDLAWRARLVHEGLKHATINIAPSQSLSGSIARIYGQKPPRVVHNARLVSESVRAALMSANRL